MAFEGAQLAPAPNPTPSASCPKTRRPPPVRPRFTATPWTRSEWPARVRSSRPLQIPHLQRLVRDAETARPVPRHRHARTTSEWPFRVRSVRRFQIPHLQRLVPTRRRPPAARPDSPPRHSHRECGLPGCAARGRASRSHTFSVWSSDAETARLPSGVTATPLTSPVWPVEGAQLAPALQIPHLQRLVLRRGDRPPPVRRSPPRPDSIRVACEGAQLAPALQIPHLQRLVRDAETARRPSRAHRHAPDSARMMWPSSVRSSRPLSRSHTFSVLSPDAETASRPSARHRHAMTQPEWPCRVRSSRPLSRSHTFSVLSSDAETARRPSASPPRPATAPEWPARGAQLAPALQIPHLQRVVIRRGDRQPPVRTHRHASDKTSVALRGCGSARVPGG